MHAKKLDPVRLKGAAPDLFDAANFTLHYIIAGLSAGALPEPQMLSRAHDLLFKAVSKAAPEQYGLRPK